MSAEEDTYCRLCADKMPKIQLISPDEDVAITSKIATKLLFINIDITSNSLPNTICFSCFDSLERTWSFLHNVRDAQKKLSEILSKTNETKIVNLSAGKPNWELKTEVKEESVENEVNDLLKVQYEVKLEKRDDYLELDLDYVGFNSSDSDVPLGETVRTRVKHKKHKKSYSDNIMTWDSVICRCGRCDAQCKNVTALQLHSLQIHNRCCIFKCLECSKKFLTYKPFVTHTRTHIKELRYVCEFCNSVFNRSSHLKRHRNDEHSCVYLTKCRNCGTSFETPEQLKDHKTTYSTELKRPKRESKDIVLKCEFCDKEFKSKSNLQQHKLVHTERSRDFSCHICGKMFFTKGTLGTHLMTHEETKPYKCEYCPLAFRARGNLQSHLSRHSGTKPFVCEQCGKSFRVKRHLKSHSIVHTDLMPFSCEYCDKTFRFKTRLNLHLRQHTGAKPYKCKYCQRDFTNGSNFKKHMKRRHGIDTSRQKFDNVVLDIKCNGTSETDA